MRHRCFIALTLACVLGLFGSVLADGNPFTARVSAAQAGICTLTSERVTPPSVSGRTHYIYDVAAFGKNDVWVQGVYLPPGIGTVEFVQYWNGIEWQDRTPPPDSLATQKVTETALVNGMPVSDMGMFGGTSSHDLWRARRTSREIWHWDGTAWSESYRLPVADYQTLAVRSEDDAWIVGVKNKQEDKSLFLHWNGARWKREPFLSDLQNIEWNAMVALSPKNAWAVGTGEGANGRQTLLVRWNGEQWQSVPSPAESKTEWRGLTAINKDDIWAVGVYQDDHASAMTMHWDGIEWKLVGVPRVRNQRHSGLDSVSAFAKDDVWAVGTKSSGRMLLHWNGVRWSYAEAPNLTGTLQQTIADADGMLWAASEKQLSFREGENWTILTLPPMGYEPGLLKRVEVVSSNEVWAAGTALERWDGATWSVVPVPQEVAPASSFVGLDSIGPLQLWVIAKYREESGDVFSVLHMDGENWSRLPNPSSNVTGGTLSDIAVLGENDIWVAGSFLKHWDGSAWTESPLPPGSSISRLYALAPNDVWAIGSSIFHWNGETWSVKNSHGGSALSVGGENDIWVGSGGSFLHYDGTEWHPVPPGDISNPGLVIYGFVRLAPNDIYAFGKWHESYANQNGLLVQHWDGTAWSTVEEDSFGAGVNDVAMVSAGEFWGVGGENVYHYGNYTLIWHFVRTCE